MDKMIPIQGDGRKLNWTGWGVGQKLIDHPTGEPFIRTSSIPGATRIDEAGWAIAFLVEADLKVHMTTGN